MALHGVVSAFDENQEKLEDYAEHLDNHFCIIANNIMDPIKQRVILLNGIGASMYYLVETIVAWNVQRSVLCWDCRASQDPLQPKALCHHQSIMSSTLTNRNMENPLQSMCQPCVRLQSIANMALPKTTCSRIGLYERKSHNQGVSQTRAQWVKEQRLGDEGTEEYTLYGVSCGSFKPLTTKVAHNEQVMVMEVDIRSICVTHG